MTAVTDRLLETRRGRLLVVAMIATAVIAVAMIALTAITGSGVHTPGDGDATTLATRVSQAGEVEVRMTPLALDATGARIRVSFDTHSGSLDLDPASAAQLRIDGAPAPSGTWDGARPGGHHREGTLAFATPIRAGATVELRVTGLASDVVATWTVPVA